MLVPASPPASVTPLAGDTEPPWAFTSTKSTVTPATGRPWLSLTFTMSESSGELTRAICAFPLTISMRAGAPSLGKVRLSLLQAKTRGSPATARAESLKAFTTRPWSRFEYPTPPWRHAYARGQSISGGPQKKGPGSHLAAKFCNQGNLRMGQAAYMPGPTGGAEI